VKVKPGIGRQPLPDHADAALAAALQPFQDPAMNVRPVVEGLHHVHDDRPAAQRRHLLVEGAVARVVARHQQHLHEAVVALGQDLCELAAGVVVHHVGRHRRAVVVALHCGRPGRQHALGRPAAGARIHRLVAAGGAAPACCSGVGRLPALAASKPITQISSGEIGT
jgi:hypothetical protein